MKEDYIKAIEELNQEYKKLYNNKSIRRSRNRKYKLMLLKNGYYSLFFVTIKLSIINFIKRGFNKVFKIQKPKIKQENEIKLNKKMTGKKVIYTCILNDYDELKSPLVLTDNAKYIVFSDNPNITKDTRGWEYKKISDSILKKCRHNPILINRYLKMHPKELFKNYDLALYVDGSVRIISDLEDMFFHINDKTGLAMHKHSKRCDIYEEAKTCIKSHIGNKKAIKSLVKEYKEEGFPKNYGLYEATLIASDLNNPVSAELLDLWWHHFNEVNTLRDQLSLTYILWKSGYNYEDIGLLGNNLYDNPKIRRELHNFNKK